MSSNGTHDSNGSNEPKWVVETVRRFVSFPRELANTPEEAIALCLQQKRLFAWEEDHAEVYLGEPGKPADQQHNGNGR